MERDPEGRGAPDITTNTSKEKEHGANAVSKSREFTCTVSVSYSVVWGREAKQKVPCLLQEDEGFA